MPVINQLKFKENKKKAFLILVIFLIRKFVVEFFDVNKNFNRILKPEESSNRKYWYCKT